MLLLLAAATLLAQAPAAQQPVTRADLEALLRRHATAVAGTPDLPPVDLCMRGTLTNGNIRQNVTTWVRGAPFAFRRDIEPVDPPGNPFTMITDGRYAWDAAGRPLDELRARLCLEAAFVDGLRYGNPNAIIAGPDSDAPWHLRDHDGDGELPAECERGLRTRWLGLTTPAGTMLQFHFDATDWRLHEVGCEEPQTIRWTRYAAWSQFGSLRLPTLQISGVVGSSQRVLSRIESVDRAPTFAAELFAGCPRAATPRLQPAGALMALPHTVPGAGVLVLPHVELSGRSPALAVLDTGATRSALLPELAAALHLTRLGPMQIATLSTGMHASTTWLESLRLGEHTGLQLIVPVLALPNTEVLPPDRQPGLLVGNDVVLSESPVLDLAAGALLLRGRPVTPLVELQPRGPVVRVPLLSNGNSVSVAVDVNGHSLRALFDTGMPYTLRLSAAALRSCGLPGDKQAWLDQGAVPITSVEGGGKRVASLAATMAGFDLGPVHYESPVVVLGEFEAGEATTFDAILGAGALLPFARVGVDLERQLLELEVASPASAGAHSARSRADGAIAIRSAGPFLGIVVQAALSSAPAGRLSWPVVVDLATGSPAARAGIQRGQWLRRLDGVSTIDLPLTEVNRRLWLGDGRSVGLELVRPDGSAHAVRLP